MIPKRFSGSASPASPDWNTRRASATSMLKTDAKSVARVEMSPIKPVTSSPSPTIRSANAEKRTAALLKLTWEVPKAVAAFSPNFRIPAADLPNATFTALNDSSRSEAAPTELFTNEPTARNEKAVAITPPILPIALPRPPSLPSICFMPLSSNFETMFRLIAIRETAPAS